MHDKRREIVAVLLKQGRKDLAKQFVTAPTLVKSSELGAANATAAAKKIDQAETLLVEAQKMLALVSSRGKKLSGQLNPIRKKLMSIGSDAEDLLLDMF